MLVVAVSHKGRIANLNGAFRDEGDVAAAVHRKLGWRPGYVQFRGRRGRDQTAYAYHPKHPKGDNA